MKIKDILAQILQEMDELHVPIGEAMQAATVRAKLQGCISALEKAEKELERHDDD